MTHQNKKKTKCISKKLMIIILIKSKEFERQTLDMGIL